MDLCGLVHERRTERAVGGPILDDVLRCDERGAGAGAGGQSSDLLACAAFGSAPAAPTRLGRPNGPLALIGSEAGLDRDLTGMTLEALDCLPMEVGARLRGPGQVEEIRVGRAVAVGAGLRLHRELHGRPLLPDDALEALEAVVLLLGLLECPLVAVIFLAADRRVVW